MTLFRNDFCSTYFKEGWDQCYKDYSRDDDCNFGLRIQYPIKCRLHLKWMKKGHYKKGDGTIHTKSQSFIEMVRLQIKKINC